MLPFAGGELDRYHASISTSTIRVSASVATSSAISSAASGSSYRRLSLRRWCLTVVRSPPRALADDEFDLTLLQRVLDICQALQHERAVPEVCFCIAVCETEDHEQALFELVCPLRRVLRSVVALGSLRFLHPVQGVVAVFDTLVIQIPDALSLDLHVALQGASLFRPGVSAITGRTGLSEKIPFAAV